MPALLSVIAKAMVLVDALLEPFVTVTLNSYVNAAAVCDVTNISGALTPCGQDLVNNLANLIYQVVRLGGVVFGGLAVTI